MLTSGVGREEAEARQTVAEQAGSLRASVCQLRRKLGGVTLLRTAVELWLLAAAAGGGCVQLGRVAREQWGWVRNS